MLNTCVCSVSNSCVWNVKSTTKRRRFLNHMMSLELMRPLTASSDAIETLTCREHQAVPQLFCVAHTEELWLMNHKNCQTVTSLEKAAKDLYTDDYCKKIVKSTNDLLAWVSCCKDVAGREKVKLNEKKQTAIDKIKEIRTDIEVYLDMLEVTAKNDIESICQKEANILVTKFTSIILPYRVCINALVVLIKRCQ